MHSVFMYDIIQDISDRIQNTNKVFFKGSTLKIRKECLTA